MAEDQILHVPVDELIPFVHQSRTEFDEAELRNLAEDIKANGQLQPGVGWLDPGRGKYVLICGERRWRALKMAELPTMAIKVIAGSLTQGEMLAINLSENLQRQNLNCVERARSFQRLSQLENLSSKQIATRMHVSDATVSRDLSILVLPAPLLAEVARGTVGVSLAYELSRIDNPAMQLEMATAVMEGKVSRDELAQVVRKKLGSRKTSPKGGRISCRLEGGVSITMAKGGQSLTKADVQRVIRYLSTEVVKKLEDGGGSADLAQAS
jgi:ParB family transcriptional regulator, chromosome partitioning protein